MLTTLRGFLVHVCSAYDPLAKCGQIEILTRLLNIWSQIGCILNLIKVIAGAYNIKRLAGNSVQIRNIAQSHLHQLYTNTSIIKFDLALVKTDQPYFVTPSVKSIPMETAGYTPSGLSLRIPEQR